MIYWLLFIEFFIIGTFAVGGGLATLPYLIALGDKYGWFTKAALMDMVAISESTPGPIGINMATYVGYMVGKIPGSIIASIAVMLSGLIFMIVVARSLEHFKNSFWLVKIFYGLRPTIAALIGFAAYTMLYTIVGDMTLSTVPILGTLLLFTMTFVLMAKTKLSPVSIIAIAAALSLIIPL